MWDSLKKSFKAYLQLEKSLSKNAILAYVSDVEKFTKYLVDFKINKKPEEIVLADLQAFIHTIAALGIADTSQARIISGIKSFFHFCIVEDIITVNPTILLESPKLKRALPDTLSFDEIELVIQSIDLSTPQGIRNKAILETLYSCGLRVSELTQLRISQLYFDVGFVRIIGKGNKERLVPIGKSAIKHINIYIHEIRKFAAVKKGNEDFVFLNNRGQALSRIMIFYIIKDAVAISGLQKTVSPHTFRHSFATHLIEGGANLRAVQEMLGHESIITTEIYTHLDSDFLRTTLEKFHPSFQKK